MLPRDWLARFATRRVDRRQAGLLGTALLALLVEPEQIAKSKRKRLARRERVGQARQPRPRLQCGGIAGLPCPKGFTCIDDPSDDCDPEKGGADCFGICVRRIKDVCATVRCRAGTKCCPECGRACIPDTVSCKEACTSTPCNESTCGPGEYCCNESCSRCAKLGQGCTREICPPKDPDDGEPCGRNRCGRGEYCCNPSCGVCAPLNGGCAAVYCPPDSEPWPEPEPWPGGERCGKTVCPRGQYCCNASCGICAPPDAACIMIACEGDFAE